MGQHFADLDSLFSAAIALADSAARLAMFRAHREMLGESVLFGIALQGNDLAKQGVTARAIRTYEIGAEAAEAAELPRPRLKLLLQLADLVSRTATRPEAMTAGERAHGAAAALVEAGHLDALGAAVNSASLVAELARQEGDAPRGRAILAETRRLACSARSANAELWVLRNLLSLTLSAGSEPDWPSATEYALEVERLLGASDDGAADPAKLPAPALDVFADVLRVLTRHAYDDVEDFALSASLARVWTRVAPQDSSATRDLALALMRCGDFVGAEPLWRQLLESAPDDESALANLSGSLSGRGKGAEALTYLDRAIALKPDDLQYRSFRVKLKRGLGHIVGAIVDLDAIVGLSEAAVGVTAVEAAGKAPAVSTPGVADVEANERAPAGGVTAPTGAQGLPDTAPRSQIQYERNMPVRDRLDLVLLERAMLHEELGDLKGAYADLNRVARESDPATAAHALRKRSRLLASEGRGDDALGALREAVQRAPDDAASALALGTMLADRQEDEAAVQTLSRLVLHEDRAAAVVTALGPVIERAPKDTKRRLVRGFAAEAAGRPSIANEDFSVVIENDPANAHMYFRRGRVRLMRGTLPGEAAWNAGLSMRRVLDATSDLARAASLDPNDEDARYSLRWLVDRICTTWRFHGSFRDPTEEMRAVFTVFPGLQETLGRFAVALDLASSREYERALSEWRAMQRELIEMDMPVSACRVDAYLADSLLRLFDVQGALDHLQSADQLIFLIGVPMTRQLAEQAAQTRRLTRQRSGSDALVLEQEFADVYGLFLEDSAKRADLLRVDAFGRVGDYAGMLALLARSPELESAPDEEFFSAYANIAARLRDAGEVERALALISRLDPLARSSQDRLVLLNLRGSIQQRMGNQKDAQAAFEKARDVAQSDDPTFAPFVAMNVARALIDQEKFAESREILNANSASLADPTPLEQMTLHWLRAEVAEGLDEHQDALAEVQLALALAEELRGDLRDAKDRIAWQGRLVGLYDVAIWSAVRAENLPLILELAERTRARAYLDLVQTGTSVLPESASELVADVKRLESQREILLSLLDSVRTAGSTFVDVELERALQRNAPDVVVVQRTATGRLVMSPARIDEALSEVNGAISRLNYRIDEARLAASVSTVGEVLGTEAIADLLRTAGSGGSDTHDAIARNIVLAEYFVVRNMLICLVMRSDESQPSLHLIDVPLAQVGAIVEAAAWSKEDASDGSWQDVLSKVVAPVVERSLRDELLWIVPHGALHQAPLHAAMVDGAPLLERNPICYSPSASIMAECRKRSEDRFVSAVVLGDSHGDLPYARAESQYVAARFHTTALVGDAATPAAFNDALQAAGATLDVLHLACHGTFIADDVLQSGIKLAGADEEDATLTARDLVGVALPVDLVVLSACVTARTRVFAGDEPVGLTRAFLSAGAASVMATLWLTNDVSTQLIVEGFYDALLQQPRPDGDLWRKARGLREAALAVRATTVAQLSAHADEGIAAVVRDLAREHAWVDSDRPFESIRFWAPFVLVGDWG